MGALKSFSGQQLNEITGMGVLDFLIFKDLRCENPVLCAKRHQSASTRTGIISKLRKDFEEVGRKGTYDPVSLQGDPTMSPLVSSYITYIRTEQGLSGVCLKVLQQSRGPNGQIYENHGEWYSRTEE